MKDTMKVKYILEGERKFKGWAVQNDYNWQEQLNYE